MLKTLLKILACCCVLQPAYAQRATDTFKLYFDLNVPSLSSTTERKIDLLIFNDKLITGSTVMIVGYADYLGSEKYNKDLSMLRARNVKDYLVKYGVNEKDIKVCLGKGRVDRVGMSGKDGYATDRRVDIVVNNRTKVKPPIKPKPPVRPPVRVTRDTVPSVATANTPDEISKLKPGSVFLLKNVYFPSDRHTIQRESYKTLEMLYGVLEDNPNMKISIEGHVCCIRENVPDAWDIDTYEPTLSVNRAKAIYDYLLGKGITADRLMYAGFGKKRPVAIIERTDEDRERNRRVEIRILENRK